MQTWGLTVRGCIVGQVEGGTSGLCFQHLSFLFPGVLFLFFGGWRWSGLTRSHYPYWPVIRCVPQIKLELNIVLLPQLLPGVGTAGVSHHTRLVASYFAFKKKTKTFQ